MNNIPLANIELRHDLANSVANSGVRVNMVGRLLLMVNGCNKKSYISIIIFLLYWISTLTKRRSGHEFQNFKEGRGSNLFHCTSFNNELSIILLKLNM